MVSESVTDLMRDIPSYSSETADGAGENHVRPNRGELTCYTFSILVSRVVLTKILFVFRVSRICFRKKAEENESINFHKISAHTENKQYSPFKNGNTACIPLKKLLMPLRFVLLLLLKL